MQAKILRRPRTAATIVLATDFVIAATAVVLGTLRSKVSATYTLTGNGEQPISMSHPYDFFIIAVIIALVIAASMTAFMMIGILSKKNDAKPVPKIIGSAVLLTASVLIILLSFFMVRGDVPVETKYYSYSDSNACIVIAEEKYSDGKGLVKVYMPSLTDNSVKLIATSWLESFAENEERYSLSWQNNKTLLRIDFIDGKNARMLQISPDMVG
ncbi:MAG: hypothetical protein IJZ95_09485 [Oscillospiraceae bacterium]|nr:hypothetical protein [Oscillospiraceae bacterium]